MSNEVVPSGGNLVKASNIAELLITGNSLSDIQVDNGDAFIGVKNIIKIERILSNPQNILLLIQQYENIDCASEKFLAMKDELDSYIKPREERDIIGLEQKLTDGGRANSVLAATELKDKFSKRLARYEFSSHMSALHLNLLTKIEEKFNSHIYPLIQSGHSIDVIDQLISEVIIQPLAEEVAPADASLTAKHVRGMMYLLTGNCHLKWK